MRKEIVPILKRLTDAVHKEGGGRLHSIGTLGLLREQVCHRHHSHIGPSHKFCTFRYNFCRPMTTEDLTRVREDFGKAALMAKKAGFDAGNPRRARISA